MLSSYTHNIPFAYPVLTKKMKHEILLKALENELKRKEEIEDILRKKLEERHALGRPCSICELKISQVCGQEDIFESPCGSCEPDGKFRYYCTPCFIKKHSLKWLKDLIKEMEEKEKLKIK